MKVALLTYSTRPRGGVVHTLALAEALAAAGVEVTVLTLGRGGDAAFFRPVDPAVETIVAPLPDRPDETVGQRVLRSIEVLAAHIDHDRYDVVHAQDCISANAAARGGPCVRTVHHLDTFTTPELAACHERAIVTPWAHICVSGAVASELAEGWGIEATVIPNGVDAERFAAAAREDDGPATARRGAWRDRLPPGPIVLNVGGIEPRKGTLDLVDAVALLRATHPTARLVVAGGETLFDYRDYRVEVDDRARRLGVDPVVLGPVPEPDLPALVASADVFAFPSLKEGFGLAAMEALAAGVPVVMRDLPVLREVYAGTARFASTPGAFARELARAIDGPDAGRAARGRALADRHRWADAARAHLSTYERVLPTLSRGTPFRHTGTSLSGVRPGDDRTTAPVHRLPGPRKRRSR